MADLRAMHLSEMHQQPPLMIFSPISALPLKETHAGPRFIFSGNNSGIDALQGRF